jgi:NAD(P)H-dependent FMN reductase/ketosteroid isomerase-like protein
MSRSKALRVGVLVGSLRKQSFSRKIARALIERAPDTLDCRIIEIGDLPLYNEDLDDAPPKPWVRFREELAASDAFLFVTPEYNRSMPGCLKNATDVGSRPEDHNLFDGRPAGIVGVSPYDLGAFGANHAMRQTFVYLNLRVMQQPEAYVGHAKEILGPDGTITRKDTDAVLATFMTAFADWVDLAGAPAAGSFRAFMAEREAASNAYIAGDAAPLMAMVTARDPATFFPPGGDRIAGAKAAAQAQQRGAEAFAKGSRGRFEVMSSGSSGRLAFWTGVQHAEMRLKGKDGSVPMQLRTTEVFRFEEGGWKLVHRHADMPEPKG